MAFRQQWTPLGAVAGLASQAGAGKARFENLRMAMEDDQRKRDEQFREAELVGRATQAAQQTQLGYAQLSDQRQKRMADEKRAEQAFSLQLAHLSRQERKLGAEQAETQQRAATQSENLKQWESLRDSIPAADYVRGLVAIKGGKMPPALSQARAVDKEIRGATTMLRQVNEAVKGAKALLSGPDKLNQGRYYLDDDGRWRQDRFWTSLGSWGDAVVDDPQLIQELNTAKATIEQYEQFGATLRGAAMQQQMMSPFDMLWTGASEVERSQIQAFLNAGHTKEEAVMLARQAAMGQ